MTPRCAPGQPVRDKPYEAPRKRAGKQAADWSLVTAALASGDRGRVASAVRRYMQRAGVDLGRVLAGLMPHEREMVRKAMGGG